MGISGKGDPNPFLLEGGDIGALLIHGLTGSPAEMRPIGEFLNERGLTVLGPLLPGHGTRIEDLNRVHWTEWTAAAEQALAVLQSRCSQVFVAGLSMGGLLTLYLASRHPELAGIVTYAAALDVTDWRRHLVPILKYVLKTAAKTNEHWADPQRKELQWSYDAWPVGAIPHLNSLRDEVIASLPRITCPTLLTFSAADQLIELGTVEAHLNNIGAKDKEAYILQECGHNMVLDKGWDELAQRTYDFIVAQAGEPTAAGAPDP